MIEFDCIVIGAGPGGYVAAIRAAQLGMKTAIIEKMDSLGGTCLNIGCIPSKAIIDSCTKYRSITEEFPQHGIHLASTELNLKTLINRKNEVVQKLTSGVAGLIKGNKITKVQGIAVLRANSQTSSGSLHSVDVYENPASNWSTTLGGLGQSLENNEAEMLKKAQPRETLHAKRIILATGSVASELPDYPFNGKNILSSTGILSLTKVPKTLLVIGAGAIGLEMAYAWACLGSKVTVVEQMDQILPNWDSQIARNLQRELKKIDIDVILNTRVQSLNAQKTGVQVQLQDKGLKAEVVLVASGRSANIQSAGIIEAGVLLKENESVVSVNENYETSVSGIFAIGDLIEGQKLAHKAEEEGIAAVERMNGIPARVDYGAIPSVVYTEPEAATIGLSEDELKKNGRNYKKGVFNTAANGRAIAMGIQAGFVKILSDPKTDRILGAHIFSRGASELISELVTIFQMRGTAEDIARIVHAHPTLCEVVKESALAVHGRAIHSISR